MAASMADSDFEVLLEQPRIATSWRKLAIGASASLLLCGAVARLSYASGLSAGSVAEVQQDFQVIAAPGREFCAGSTANCFSKGCCRVEGHSCFTTAGEGQAKCMKACDPKKYLCTQPDAIMGKVLEEGKVVKNSLYCFAVVTVDTGSPEPSFERELMSHQAQMGAGIFACEETGLFSDGAIHLDNGVPFTQVFDTEGDWKFAKRKETGAWINTGLFSQVWRAVQSSGKWDSAEWIVKADPDAVFVVPRLKKRLESTFEVEPGSYLVNCPYVDYGFFGNLEVMSHQAFSTLLDNLDQCKADSSINWKVGIKNGKYGPSGEDLFAQMCMDKHSVKRVAAFDLTQDGACEAKRDKDQRKNKKWEPHCESAYGASFHPFKKVEAWSKCMEQTMKAYPEPL